jgi:hypothetical protein
MSRRSRSRSRWSGGRSRPPVVRAKRDSTSNRKPATSNIVALVLTILGTAVPALAGTTTSAITGRVVIGDAAAPGVTVTAASSMLQHPRTTLTGPRGTYWLDALPPGEYDVTFSLAGHTTLTRRALVELGRVGRADATLERNEDEETVTSTAITANIAESTAIATHFDDETLDRLPLGRAGNAEVAPDRYSIPFPVLDGVPSFLTLGGVAEDLIEQTTVVRGAAPIEAETYGGKAVWTLTRRPTSDFFLTLRDTLTSNAWVEGNQLVFPETGEDDSVAHLAEATGGGRIVSDRLWFFAGAWLGERAPTTTDQRGLNGKLDAQLGAAHHLAGSYLRSESKSSFFDFGSSTAWLRHTAVYGPRLTWETQVSRATRDAGNQPQPVTPLPPPSLQSDVLHTRASYVVPARSGDHVLTAGATTLDGNQPIGYRAFFAGDRWSSARWVVNAGLRYEDDDFEQRVIPRLAATFDLRGDGTRALAASIGEYSFAANPVTVRVATLGYAAAIGRSGSVRADAFRKWGMGIATNSLQLDTRYRLFDRFEAGATYTYDRVEDDGGFGGALPDHSANGWISAELPVGEHELGVTILQRYLSITNPPFIDERIFPTDLALRYAIPFGRLGALAAADVVNVFGSGHAGATIPRALRFWLRVRV